jgi:small subunit ribosomal protein S15
MARIHARTKGKSGSKRPAQADLSFVTLKPKEVEKIIVDLAKDAVKPSKIGMILRDTHAVPDVKKLTGKTIGKILKEAQTVPKIPEDLENLVNKAKALKKHLQNNTRDVHNKRGLILVESKIRRFAKYYKKTGKIPQNWKYN